VTYKERRLAVLRVLRALGVFALARQLTRGQLRILCYHGFSVADEHRFRPGLFIEPRELERRLAHLVDHGYHVLPLDEAVQRLRDGTLPPRSTVITIDDGFRSTYTHALPLFKKYGVHATLYLTTYYVVHQRPIFNLTTQYLLWRVDRPELDLRGLGVPELDAVLPWGSMDAAARDQVAQALVVHGHMHLARPEREALLDELARRAGVDLAAVDRTGLFSLVDAEQAAAFRASGMGVELHTHRHWSPNEEELALRELADNGQVIEDITGYVPRHLCYPSGRFDGWREEWLEAAGVRSATTCVAGFADVNTDPYRLPRFLDGADIDQLDFEAEMSGLLEIGRRLRRRFATRAAAAQKLYNIDPAEQRPRVPYSPLPRLAKREVERTSV
jgi:peptidoglycan/xylan/chitin deacetylase (PgdA/CDA1 family)